MQKSWLSHKNQILKVCIISWISLVVTDLYWWPFPSLQFHLNQAKLRSKIRIQDGRGKWKSAILLSCLSSRIEVFLILPWGFVTDEMVLKWHFQSCHKNLWPNEMLQKWHFPSCHKNLWPNEMLQKWHFLYCRKNL